VVETIAYVVVEVVVAIDLWSGVGAAAAGAVITALCTAWVSTRLDQQRELRETCGAVRVVRQELSENRDKVRRAGDDPRAIENLRDTTTDGKNDLTLGDWLGSKAQFAGLTLRNHDLWRAVAKAYADISDFNRGACDKPPSATDLETLVSRLNAEEEKLTSKLGWPHLRRLKSLLTRR
jgi:hypothetical protein